MRFLEQEKRGYSSCFSVGMHANSMSEYICDDFNVHVYVRVFVCTT